MQRWLRYGVVAAIAVFAGSQAAVAAQAAKGKGEQAKAGAKKARSTQEVLDHHLKAFGDRDMAATLSDYAADAVMFTADGPLKGHAAITPVFKAFFTEFAKPGVKFTMKRQTVEGDYAYLLWTAETADNVYELATDAFVIRNGKIVAHFIAAKATPKNK